MKSLPFVVIAVLAGAILSGFDGTAQAGPRGGKSSSSFYRGQSFNMSQKSRIGSPRQSFVPPARRSSQPIQKFNPGFGSRVSPKIAPKKSLPVKPAGTGFGKKISPLPTAKKPTILPTKPIAKFPVKPIQKLPAKPIQKLPLGPSGKLPKPLDPGIGNGQGNGHGQHWHHHHKHFHLWLGCHPKPCHWWFDYCPTIVTYSPTVCVPVCYNYVVCDYRVGGQVAFPDVRFRLGITGLFLPGRGMGIEKVEENSPADLHGLKPGMVIAKCNGVLLDNEESFQEVMRTSNGILALEIVQAEETEPVALTIDLRSTFSRP